MKQHVGGVRARGLVDALEASFEDAARTPDGIAVPVALVWTDPTEEWVSLVARLRSVWPHVFALGPYKPADRTGPAIWLRCVVDRTLADVKLPDGVVPVLYLAGVARQMLRAGEECLRELQPLIELQYRGRVWHQKNGQDWTVKAFLTSEDGLGLDVAQDEVTREAALRAVPLLVDASIASLAGRRLEADDFDRLSVIDPTRDLLRWMSDGEASRKSEDSQWQAFCSVCRSDFGFDPEPETRAGAASRLVQGDPKWAGVWQRFREAPKLYSGVATLLREVPAQIVADEERTPVVNQVAEQSLRTGLTTGAGLSHGAAIEKVVALEAQHGHRREWVWAQLGESALARALEPLCRLAAAARSPLGGASVEEAASAYASGGWRCDRAALEALSAATSPADAAVVQATVKALYLPWLERSARHFQSLVGATPDGGRELASVTTSEKGACIVFVDGLRFDIASVLKERLDAKGLRTRLTHRLAPMPTVTATAKPLATVVSDALEGGPDIVDFNPRLREGGQSVTAQRLRDLMAKRGIDLLENEMRSQREATIGGWLETGHLDEMGHKLDARLATQIESEIEVLLDQIAALLESGWLRVQVVTDHGWLLMPGGLPRVDLPSFLAATKWARCATVKGESQTDIPTYPWYWDPNVRIASPPGVACFSAGHEYAHGGVSPQECVVPELIVEQGGAPTTTTIANVSWRGMRCKVAVTTNDPTVRIDLRLNWRQPATTIVSSTKEVGPAGEASLVVDDSHEGAAATVVVIDTAGNVLDRKPTTVGEPA